MSTYEFEQLAATFERMSLHMCEIAVEKRDAGDSDGSHHAAGGAEAFAMAAAFVKMRLTTDLVVVA